jgi:hypothetical protein
LVKISGVPFWHGQRVFCQHDTRKPHSGGTPFVSAARNFAVGRFTPRLRSSDSPVEGVQINQFASSVNGLAAILPAPDHMYF